MCKTELGKETIQNWLDVKQIADAHDYPSVDEGRRLTQNVKQELIDDLLSRQLQFNPNYYKIEKPPKAEL
jgi:hypothetical protein